MTDITYTSDIELLIEQRSSFLIKVHYLIYLLMLLSSLILPILYIHTYNDFYIEMMGFVSIFANIFVAIFGCVYYKKYKDTHLSIYKTLSYISLTFFVLTILNLIIDNSTSILLSYCSLIVYYSILLYFEYKHLEE